ncbi:hypothetical protein ACSTD2_22100, partial [Vibrio vulnificus]|uniref:hypothetical protein n=1 Tax=Vibrio vulnificus TaxID=672 RepID=UPI003ED9E081
TQKLVVKILIEPTALPRAYPRIDRGNSLNFQSQRTSVRKTAPSEATLPTSTKSTSRGSKEKIQPTDLRD